MANELTKEQISAIENYSGQIKQLKDFQTGIQTRPEDWVYKGSPFLNIGPRVQKNHYEKQLNPNYNGPKPPTQQAQKHPLNLTDKSPIRVVDGGLWYTSLPNCPYITNEGYRYIVQEYIDRKHVVVKFIDYDYTTCTDIFSVKCGCIKFPYHPHIFNNFFGVGKYDSKSYMKIYKTWRDMFERVYDTRERNLNNNPSYVGIVSICDLWFNFQYFADWMYNYSLTINQENDIEFHIDKDILQWGATNKIYSPNTCCLIPALLNVALSGYNWANKDTFFGTRRTANGKFVCSVHDDNGRNNLGTYETQEEAFLVYKKAKEKRLQDLADYYYSINAIHKEIRDIVHKIEIQPDGSEKLR